MTTDLITTVLFNVLAIAGSFWVASNRFSAEFSKLKQEVQDLKENDQRVENDIREIRGLLFTALTNGPSDKRK